MTQIDHGHRGMRGIVACLNPSFTGSPDMARLESRLSARPRHGTKSSQMMGVQHSRCYHLHPFMKLKKTKQGVPLPCTHCRSFQKGPSRTSSDWGLSVTGDTEA